MIRICLIEDDEIMGESLLDRFELEGFKCDWAKDLTQARKLLDIHQYNLIVTDMRLPDGTGKELMIESLNVLKPLPMWIMLTGFGSVNEAVDMMRIGIADYLTKPFDLDKLVEKILKMTESRFENDDSEYALGFSPAMKRIGFMIGKLASHGANVLIQGESGVGKERVARLLHQTRFGLNSNPPFVAINCGAVTDNLIESELFGHEKGAFTGANRMHKGVFERANGGTLLLDEIGEMPLNMQIKLLRVLQEKSLTRVGGEQVIDFNVQLVSATHQNITDLVLNGDFREDLYYRIAVFNIDIPPLRDRPEDILPLAEEFVGELGIALDGGRYVLSDQAKTALLTYTWPGNIRQLKNVIQRAAVMADGRVISAESLGFDLENDDAQSEATLSDYISRCEKGYIYSALEQHKWKIAETADALGISRKNLWEKMRRLNISQH